MIVHNLIYVINRGLVCTKVIEWYETIWNVYNIIKQVDFVWNMSMLGSNIVVRSLLLFSFVFVLCLKNGLVLVIVMMFLTFALKHTETKVKSLVFYLDLDQKLIIAERFYKKKCVKQCIMRSKWIQWIWLYISNVCFLKEFSELIKLAIYILPIWKLTFFIVINWCRFENYNTPNILAHCYCVSLSIFTKELI